MTFDDDPMEAINDMQRLLVALVAAHGFQWDGAVLKMGQPIPLPLVVDHRQGVHAVSDGT